MPLLLNAFPRLLPEIALRWCHDNLPMPSLECCSDLHVALCGALHVSEMQLQSSVKHLLLAMDEDTAFFIDNCLQQKNVTLKQYISCFTNVGAPTDGLFLWLASKAFVKHINIVHGNSVWTTRRCAIPDLEDGVIVFLMNRYMFSPSCATLNEKQETVLVWPSPAQYLTTMVSFPRVFNDPVADVPGCCAEMDLSPVGEEHLIQDLLQELLGRPYR